MLWTKVILLFLAVPALVDVLIPWLILNLLHKLTYSSLGILQISGAILAATGLFAVGWVCQAFVRRGKDTPAPFDPPYRFVSTGLYRWLRNPMYLSIAVLIPFGETLFFETPWLIMYSAVLMLFLQLYIVYVEEPALTKRFGRPYKKYLRTVPRWIPRIPKDN
jgi:protein-S-isoprenylcysteine O-methyltransferase Ste14